MTDNRIASPIAQGQQITIPKGVPYLHRGEKRVTGKTYKVTAHLAHDGWVDTHNDHKNGRGYVVLPSIVWSGSGGYWSTLKITPEIAEVIGVPVPTIPELTGLRLDAQPSFGLGHDNRD